MTIRDFDALLKSYKAGADAHFINPFYPAEVITKINALIEHTRRIKAEILRRAQHTTSYSCTTSTPQPPPLPLITSEQKVFQTIATGYSCKVAGVYLHISTKTVQTHLRNIYKKLGLENRYQLMYFALKNGYDISVCSDFSAQH